MAEVINLDVFTKEDRVIRWQNTDHAFAHANMQAYFVLLEGRNAGEQSEQQQIRQAIKLIHLLAPTLTVEDLESMPLPALNSLFKIIEQDVADMTSTPEGGEGAEAGE